MSPQPQNKCNKIYHLFIDHNIFGGEILPSRQHQNWLQLALGPGGTQKKRHIKPRSFRKEWEV